MIEAARRSAATDSEAPSEPTVDLEVFEQLLPRGAIPAVDDPVFVCADPWSPYHPGTGILGPAWTRPDYDPARRPVPPGIF